MLDHGIVVQRAGLVLLDLQPYLRVCPGHGAVKDLHPLGDLHLFLLQKAPAGDPGAADIVENVDLFQITGLLADDADRVFTLYLDALCYVILDLVPAALVTVAAHHTGAVGAACELHVLLMGFSGVLGLDFFHTVFIVIGPVRPVAGTHNKFQSLRDMLAVFPIIGTVQQRIVVFRTVPDVLKPAVAYVEAAPNIAAALDQQAAGGLPGEAQHGLPLVGEVLPVAPADRVRVVLPGIALGIEPPGQVVQLPVHIPGHGIRPKCSFMVSLSSFTSIWYSWAIQPSHTICL